MVVVMLRLRPVMTSQVTAVLSENGIRVRFASSIVALGNFCLDFGQVRVIVQRLFQMTQYNLFSSHGGSSPLKKFLRGRVGLLPAQGQSAGPHNSQAARPTVTRC